MLSAGKQLELSDNIQEFASYLNETWNSLPRLVSD